LIATGPGGDDTLIQTLNVTVEIPPIAQFSASADTVFLPNAFVGFTNTSTNANGYNWDFGDGNFSNNANPWNQYATAGVYSVELIAVNNSCANDTTSISVIVLNANGINESSSLEMKIFPNPTESIIWISLPEAGELKIYDAIGKIVVSKSVTQGIQLIDIHALSNGAYLVNFIGEKVLLTTKLVKSAY
jgi:PKD repeat protein